MGGASPPLFTATLKPPISSWMPASMQRLVATSGYIQTSLYTYSVSMYFVDSFEALSKTLPAEKD